MSAKKKLKLKESKDLEELTEVEFERGLIRVIRELGTQKQNAINMLNDIGYYESKGYKIYYYFNKKEGTYSYFAEEKNIGFAR